MPVRRVAVSPADLAGCIDNKPARNFFPVRAEKIGRVNAHEPGCKRRRTIEDWFLLPALQVRIHSPAAFLHARPLPIRSTPDGSRTISTKARQKWPDRLRQVRTGVTLPEKPDFGEDHFRLRPLTWVSSAVCIVELTIWRISGLRPACAFRD
jgi:hypothetical protein